MAIIPEIMGRELPAIYSQLAQAGGGSGKMGALKKFLQKYGPALALGGGAGAVGGAMLSHEDDEDEDGQHPHRMGR